MASLHSRSVLSAQYQRYSLAFQALPWLDASFRYSRVPDWAVTQPHYYDRSFGLKIRLLQETDNLPDVSLGIRDLLGTGVYGSEYLVASKRIGSLDFTGGLGWGRLADNSTLPNPFGYLLSSFKTRTVRKWYRFVRFRLVFSRPQNGRIRRPSLAYPD